MAEWIRVSRRRFVMVSAGAAAVTAAAACAPQAPAPQQAPPAQSGSATQAPAAAPTQAAPAAAKPAAKPAAATPSSFREAPMLAELVKAGKLPPVEQRLPPQPLVVKPTNAIGKYGGTLRGAGLAPE